MVEGGSVRSSSFFRANGLGDVGRTEFHLQLRLLPRSPGQDLRLDLYGLARIGRQEGEEEAGGLGARGEGVEDGVDFGEVARDHGCGSSKFVN
jgi:hypothetical protein